MRDFLVLSTYLLVRTFTGACVLAAVAVVVVAMGLAYLVTAVAEAINSAFPKPQPHPECKHHETS